MKKYLTLIVFSLIAVSLSPDANAAGKKLLSSAPKAKAALVDVPRCNSEYCVKVVLSSGLGQPGNLRVYQKVNGKYAPTSISCSAIGGNPNAWDDEAIFTPDGVHSVFQKGRFLQYNGAPSKNYEWPSYFFRPGKENNVAIHTGPMGKNSHGCVRAPCAKAVHDLPGDVEVDVVYKN